MSDPSGGVNIKVTITPLKRMILVTDFEPLEQRALMDALALRYEFVSMKKDGLGGARIVFEITSEEKSHLVDDLFEMFERTVSPCKLKPNV